MQPSSDVILVPSEDSSTGNVTGGRAARPICFLDIRMLERWKTRLIAADTFLGVRHFHSFNQSRIIRVSL